MDAACGNRLVPEPAAAAVPCEILLLLLMMMCNCTPFDSETIHKMARNMSSAAALSLFDDPCCS
jgi:hypothetical protein